MLFFGLICGTLPELFKTSEKSDPESSWTPFIIALSLAYLFFHVLENIGSTLEDEDIEAAKMIPESLPKCAVINKCDLALNEEICCLLVCHIPIQILNQGFLVGIRA